MEHYLLLSDDARFLDIFDSHPRGLQCGHGWLFEDVRQDRCGSGFHHPNHIPLNLQDLFQGFAEFDSNQIDGKVGDKIYVSAKGLLYSQNHSYWHLCVASEYICGDRRCNFLPHTHG